MALTPEAELAIANEARRHELQLQATQLLAAMSAYSEATQMLGAKIGTLQVQYADVKQTLDQFNMGAGSGIGSYYGSYSILEQSMRDERFTGKAAAIDFVKANPTCTEAEAVAAYEAAAMAARPAERQYLLQSALSLLTEYRNNAFDKAIIATNDWTTFRAVLVVTPKEILMGM